MRAKAPCGFFDFRPPECDIFAGTVQPSQAVCVYEL